MNVRLLGWKRMDFVSRDGKPVKGTKIYASFKDESVTGEMCEAFFLPAGFEVPPLTVGQGLAVSFNRHGKPEQITALPEKTINLKQA